MSYTYTPYFVQDFSKERINSKNHIKSASETISKSENSQHVDEDYVDEYVHIYDDTKTKKAKNFLLGSLIALASLTVPTITMLEFDNYEFEKNRTHMLKPTDSAALDPMEMTCDPVALANGNSVVDIEEILNLLNYDSLEGIPQDIAKSIVSAAMVTVTPVDIHSKDAKEKLIKQITNTQNWIDTTAKKYKTNPTPSVYQQILEYQNKYIFANDVIDKVDFSEIMKYQKDLSVLKALIRNSTIRIERKDYNCAEKIEKEVEKAQSLVNKITEQYKLNSRIAGNRDFDGQLTEEEIINLIDFKSMEGIPIEKQQEFLRKATASYKTIYFGDVKNNAHAIEINKQVLVSLQKIQNNIDNQANNYKLQAVK